MALSLRAPSRRGFLKEFVFVAGGAAAAALSACSAAPESPGEAAARGPSYVGETSVAPAEVVPLRPGVTYDNVWPTHIPLVRAKR